jgi:hypothetical protein
MENALAKDETLEFLFNNMYIVLQGITGILGFVHRPIFT